MNSLKHASITVLIAFKCQEFGAGQDQGSFENWYEFALPWNRTGSSLIVSLPFLFLNFQCVWLIWWLCKFAINEFSLLGRHVRTSFDSEMDLGNLLKTV